MTQEPDGDLNGRGPGQDPDPLAWYSDTPIEESGDGLELIPMEPIYDAGQLAALLFQERAHNERLQRAVTELSDQVGYLRGRLEAAKGQHHLLPAPSSDASAERALQAAGRDGAGRARRAEPGSPLFSEVIESVDLHSADPLADMAGSGPWKKPRVVVVPSGILLDTAKGIELRVPLAEISGIETRDFTRGWPRSTSYHSVTVTQRMQISIAYVCLDREQRDRLYRCLMSLIV